MIHQEGDQKSMSINVERGAPQDLCHPGFAGSSLQSAICFVVLRLPFRWCLAGCIFFVRPLLCAPTVSEGKSETHTLTKRMAYGGIQSRMVSKNDKSKNTIIISLFYLF